MELNPGVVIVVVVAVAATFVLFRWGRRHEAAPPSEAQVTSPARSIRDSGTGQREIQLLVDWLLERAAEQTGISVTDDAGARERLAKAAETAMEEIRMRGSAQINLPFLIADESGPKHFGLRFKRKPDGTFDEEQ